MLMPMPDSCFALIHRIDSIKERDAEAQAERYEASKPLARYADDHDLQVHLKEAIHADDPMAAYFNEKKKKEQKKGRKKRKHGGKAWGRISIYAMPRGNASCAKYLAIFLLC